MDEILVQLPTGWINASRFEDLLRLGQSPHEGNCSAVRFRIPNGCQLMTDTTVRLLSMCNQLDYCVKRVILDFEDGERGVAGYLNRIGFFDCLAPHIEVLPGRPATWASKIFRGQNRGVVEIERIDRNHRDQTVLDRLSDAILVACAGRKDVKDLTDSAWMIFAELIDNVFSHSETPLDGFAALQVYKGGNCLKVTVSDSGRGMLETLRPALAADAPQLAKLPDIELLVEVFRQGLSRHGGSRGCGLKGCADKAIKFRAELDVRLPTVRVLLVPGKDGYSPNKAYCYSHLPLVWGTHICFTIELD
jgi:hypothetical protein